MAAQLTSTPLLIYEAGDRWRRTIDAWLRDDTFLVRSATVGEIRALANQVRPLVLFWELPTPTIAERATEQTREQTREQTEVSRAIRLLARQTPPPLQLLAFPAELLATAEQQLELEILGRQLGADFVLRAPEQMGVGWRLVRRYQTSHIGKPS